MSRTRTFFQKPPVRRLVAHALNALNTNEEDRKRRDMASIRGVVYSHCVYRALIDDTSVTVASDLTTDILSFPSVLSASADLSANRKINGADKEARRYGNRNAATRAIEILRRRTRYVPCYLGNPSALFVILLYADA